MCDIIQNYKSVVFNISRKLHKTEKDKKEMKLFNYIYIYIYNLQISI
jgi:hypothetical protein